MKELLLLVMLHEFFRPVQSVNGVMWSKKLEDFVPIFSVSTFAAVNHELVSKSREQETHDFKGRIVKLSYYEETNIINSKANGTRITGVIGEIWNILSEYLNFTLKPIHTDEETLGFSDDNGKYSHGLLSIIQRNRTDVVPRIEALKRRFTAAQFTIPLWQTSYRLYIRREAKYLPTWMVKLFSRRVWYAILIMYLLLSTCSYVSHAVDLKIIQKKSKASVNDHFFYNFGMICGQSYLPSSQCKSARMVELWLGLFSCLIRTAFGALLIGYMTQTTVIPPFHNLKSLLDTTSYNVYTLKGSLPSLLFQKRINPNYEKAIKLKRYFNADSMDEMYRTTCSSAKLFAMYQSEDTKKARGVYFCRLNPVGVPIFDAWIVSAISWNFTYKRTIDMGILKLYEVGFMKLLKHRWIESKNVEEDNSNTTKPIVIEQMYLILLIFGSGSLISFVILLLENLMFYCRNK